MDTMTASYDYDLDDNGVICILWSTLHVGHRVIDPRQGNETW